MQAVVGTPTVSAMSKLLPLLRSQTSSFTAPTQDVLRPARGIVYALKLAFMFWAVLGALLAGWAVL